MYFIDSLQVGILTALCRCVLLLIQGLLDLVVCIHH